MRIPGPALADDRADGGQLGVLPPGTGGGGSRGHFFRGRPGVPPGVGVHPKTCPESKSGRPSP